MVRPPNSFREAAEDWVCVRVTDMRDVDLATFRFDFDLTLAALLMHPDGTVYHRYGGRTWSDPLAYMSMDSLVRLMGDTLAEHAEYARDPRPAARPARTISDLPAFARKDRAQKVECVHCHMVHDAERDSAREAGAWTREDMWVWPAPERLGLELDGGEQSLVRSVAPASPAARAGMRAGDRLTRLSAELVRTVHDVQWVLENAPGAEAGLDARFTRDGEEHAARLTLEPGWKHASPLEYSWRAYKWGLSPGPGFGGPALGADEKRELGLDPDGFAFRVQYLVTWGENAQRGRAAREAGIREGDVVLSVAGKTDFRTVEHFHSWFRLTREAGEEVEIRLRRGDETLTVALKAPH